MINLLNSTYRPNMFIKELKMYVEYFQKHVQQNLPKPTEQQIKYFNEFLQNLFEGIEYYKNLIPQMMLETKEYRLRMMEELLEFRKRLEVFVGEHKNIFSAFKISAEELSLVVA